jgi:CRISPR system Cascade subunit CasA
LNTEKATIIEWLDEALEVPPRLLIDPDGALLVEDALRRAADAERVLNDVFNRHFRPEREREKPVKKELVRFKTLRERMQATYWERLAAPFRAFVFAVADLEQHETLAQHWADTLIRIANQTFREATEQVGDRADALRMRVEAQNDCSKRLYAQRKRWFPS